MLGSIGRTYHTAFSGLPARTWLLCLAGFLNRCGSMVLPFLSLYTSRAFGLSIGDAGLVVGLYGFGAMFGSLLGGRLTDVLGPVRVQVLTLGATALWMLLMTQITAAVPFAASVVVLGVLNDAFRPGSVTAVALSVPAPLRRKALSLNRLMMNAGWAIGPTVGGYLAEIDFRWIFVADGGTCGLAALFLWLFLRSWQPAVPEHGTPADAMRRPFRDRHFVWLLLANLLVLVAFMQYFTTGPRYFEKDLGADKSTIGWLLAINPIVITLFEMPIVQALQRRAALPLIAAGSATVGLGFLLLLLPLGLPGVALAMFVIAGGELLQMPVLGAYVNDYAPPRARGAYNGAQGMSFCVALMLAPWLGGELYENAGAAALWCTCGGLGVLGALGFLWLRRHRPG